MWRLGTWFSGGLGSVQSMVGPDGLKGLYQIKQFRDSMTRLLQFYLKCQAILI